MLSKKHIRWAAVSVLVGAAAGNAILRRTSDDSPEAFTARALHDLTLTDGWGRKVHAAILAHLPDVLVNQIGDAGPPNLNTLHDEAARTLADLAPRSNEAVSALIVALKEPGVQVNAARALGAIGPFANAAIDPLLKCAAALPSSDYRQDTIYAALCAIGPTDKRVISTFIEHLHSDQEPFSILTLMESSAKLYDRSVRDALWSVWDERDEIREGLAPILGRMNVSEDEGELFILACLRDPDTRVRIVALALLLEKSSSKPEIIAQLRDSLLELSSGDPISSPLPFYHPVFGRPSYKIWRPGQPLSYGIAEIVQTLGHSGDAAEETIPLLLDLIKQGNCQLEAATALWQISGEDSELRSALTSNFSAKHYVGSRHYALQTLRNLTPDWPGVVEYWPLALHDEDKQVRYQSILTLGPLGSKARWALPYFREMLQDPSPSVRDEAAKAITRIE